MWKEEESFAKGGKTELMASGCHDNHIPAYLHDFMSVSGVIPSGGTVPPQRRRRKKPGAC